MDYTLKLGAITKGRAVYDDAHPHDGPNHFQVRVLPEMNGIEDKDANGDLILPYYPTFFANDQYAYSTGETVWVVCDPDFNVGFIVGLASTPDGESTESLVGMIYEAQDKFGYPRSAVNDLTVNKMSDNAFMFTDTSTGIVSHVYNNSTVYLYGEDGSINITNGSKFSVSISQDGTINMKGGSSTSYLSGDETAIVEGKSTEKVGLKYIDATSNITMNSGGDVSIHSSSLNLHSATTRDSFVGGGIKETVGIGGISRTVVGGGIKDSVLVGDYDITVGAGGLNVHSGGGIKLSSPTIITISAPIVDIARTGAQTIPVNGAQGFQSGASVLSFPLPVIASPLFPLFLILNILGLVGAFGAVLLSVVGGKNTILGEGLASFFSNRKQKAPTTIPFNTTALAEVGKDILSINTTKGIVPFMQVTGKYIPDDSYVVSIIDDTQIQLNNVITGITKNDKELNSGDVDIQIGPIVLSGCSVTTTSTTVEVPSSEGLLGCYVSGSYIKEGTKVMEILSPTKIRIDPPATALLG